MTPNHRTSPAILQVQIESLVKKAKAARDLRLRRNPAAFATTRRIEQHFLTGGTPRCKATKRAGSPRADGSSIFARGRRIPAAPGAAGRLLQTPGDSRWNPAAVERFKSADEHLARLAKFLWLAPAAPEQFQPVRASALGADAFNGNPVAQLKQLLIHFIEILACLTLHG